MSGDKSFNKRLRTYYERIMAPVGRAIGKTGVSPNQITLLAGLFAVIPMIMLYYHMFFYALVTFVIAVLLDVLDGNVARATGKVTKFGKVLDHTTDRYVEFLYILGLALGNYILGWVGVFTIFGMLMPSYVRARGEAECKVDGSGVGFFERKEKIITIVIGALLYYYNFYKVFILDLAIFFVGLMSHLTAFQRLLFFKRNCHEK
ncbi:MAG: CDP-alcohol phosphatidyltransferase family protein [Candidatus Njordarchaeia archaeon]